MTKTGFSCENGGTGNTSFHSSDRVCSLHNKNKYLFNHLSEYLGHEPGTKEIMIDFQANKCLILNTLPQGCKTIF